MPAALLALSQRKRRARILFWAALITLIFGLIDFTRPLDDSYRAMRDLIRLHPSRQPIVAILTDDRTLSWLGRTDTSRAMDADVIERLFTLGARRVFFDRVFADATRANDDRKLADTFMRHRGRMFVGASGSFKEDSSPYLRLFPAPIYRDKVGVLCLNGYGRPFGLSVAFPLVCQSEHGSFLSMSAEIANIHTNNDILYRPDFSINYRTIHTYSYMDVIKNNIPKGEISGKDVIIGSSTENYHDVHAIPLQNAAPGVYFHVIGAETLTLGTPHNIGWVPGYIAGLLLAALILLLGRSARRAIFAASAAIFGLLPFLLDAHVIMADFMPGMILLGIVIFRARSLERFTRASGTNIRSGLPHIHALRHSEEHRSDDLIALKIRNYAAISAILEREADRDLIGEIVRRIHIAEPRAEIHHSEDILAWFRPGSPTTDLKEHLEGLHEMISRSIALRGRPIDVSVAFGVDTHSSQTISRRLGNAMQCAEDAARANGIVRFHDEIAESEAIWQLTMLTSLDEAIDRGDIWVAYQPKIDIASGAVIGAEALARWTHPQRGAINPEDFVRFAETHNRIDKLTQFVMSEAITAAARINRSGRDFSISVNLSAQLLTSTKLASDILFLLEAHNLRPDKLILEITETGHLERDTPTLSAMHRLIEAGIQFSIDDFGTGNATLDYLRIVPAQEVKIDKGFVMTMDASRDDRLLVQSIVEMAHSLGRRVVAEGVENEAVLILLKALGCDEAQGYLIGKPMPLGQFLSSLDQERRRHAG